MACFFCGETDFEENLTAVETLHASKTKVEASHVK